jgi:putative MATE family efflux protein
MQEENQESTMHEGEAMGGKDLTKGDIRKQLWSLAWPMMLSMFFYTLYNIVDAFWVSKISPEAIAAVSVSQIALFVMVALSMGITVGSGVLMSMYIGAKKMPEAQRVLGQSFVLSALAAFVFTIFSLVFREQLLAVTGATGAIFEPALEYFIITAAGSVLLFIMMTIMFAYNAQGDTFTPTKLFALSTAANAILDPILIFGWYGFPELGIAGAAYATLISQAVFIVLGLYSLSRPKRMLQFHFRYLSFNWSEVKKVLNIGIPASLTQAINPIGLSALMFVASLSFFEPGTIAFSIGFRIEFFAFLPAVGFGMAAMVMMGQNIGAGNVARAREAYTKAMLYGVGAAVVFGLAAIAFAEQIISIFTNDELITAYAKSYIYIVAAGYGFLAASMVEASAFQAVGKSWPGFWIFFLRFVVVSVPLAFVLTRVLHLPIEAVWAAITAGNIAAAVVGYLWFMRVMNTIDPKKVPSADVVPTV